MMSADTESDRESHKLRDALTSFAAKLMALAA
jgi:hypothetical protein